MTIQYPITAFVEAGTLAEAPVEIDRRTRNFDLPVALHAATVGCYLAFLGILALAFQSPDMIIVMAICVIYIAMAFGVPTLWSRMKPLHHDRAIDWQTFHREGIECATGRLTSSESIGQVMILPVLILGWGIAIVIIAAAVG